MVQKSYKTSKGTELPLLNLRGKEYLEVKYRLVWFREEHPEWSIETDLLNVTESSAYAKASIRDETGRIIATSHKFETVQGFPDFIEKAETGSIGRALALIGYGTQFCADELDEGKRIVDAPAQRPTKGGNVQRASAPAGATAKAQTSGEASEKENDSEPTEAKEPGDFQINFGRKYKGKKLKEIPRNEMEGYIQWLEGNDVRPGTALAHQIQFLKNAFDKMYNAKTETASH